MVEKAMSSEKVTEEILAMSLHVYPGIIEVTPQFGSREPLNRISEITTQQNEHTWNYNNSVIAFVLDGKLYAAWFTDKIVSLLKDAGFRCNHNNFYVPFSIGDYPEQEKNQWTGLYHQAQELWREEHKATCKAYCADHRLGGELSEEILNLCYQIPENGVECTFHGEPETIYPQVPHLDCVTVNRIGKWWMNNGTIVFNYHDGRTFITRKYEVIEALKSAGYHYESLYVPMSNGETITSWYEANKWQAAC